MDLARPTRREALSFAGRVILAGLFSWTGAFFLFFWGRKPTCQTSLRTRRV